MPTDASRRFMSAQAFQPVAGKDRRQGLPSRNRTPVHSTRRLDLQKERNNEQNKWSVTWIRDEWLSRIIMITAVAIMLASWIAVSLVFCLFLCFAASRPMPNFELSAENSTLMGKRLTADESSVEAAGVCLRWPFSEPRRRPGICQW